MGAQHDLLRRVQEEGVLDVAGGVALGQVERLEVVPVGLDLGPFLDRVTDALEDHLQLPPDLAQDVGVPALERRRREGDVDRLGLGQRVKPAALELGRALGDGGRDRLLGGVPGLPEDGTLLGGHAAQVGEDLGQPALAAEVVDADLLQLGLAARPGHGGEGGPLQVLHLVGHQSRLRRIS